MPVVALDYDRRLRHIFRVGLVVLAKNRPIGCPKVAHEIRLTSEGIGGAHLRQ